MLDAPPAATLTVDGVTVKDMTVTLGTLVKRHTPKNGMPQSAKKKGVRSGLRKNANKSREKKLRVNVVAARLKWNASKRKKNCIANNRLNTSRCNN